MSDSPPSPTTLTRESLYERVWTTSVVQLAKEFGISDVGLAKACKRHHIPRPPLGYWAKKAVGKAPPRPPLPVLIDPKLQTVTLNPTLPRPSAPISAGDLPSPPPAATPLADPEIAAAFQRFIEACPDIKVPASLRDPLPLVTATLEALRRGASERSSFGRAESRHLVSPHRAHNEACLDVQVGRESIARAARLLNTLLRTLQTCGFETEETRDQYRRTPIVVAFGHRFQLRLRELTRREPHTATTKELADQARYPTVTRIPKWDYLPRGDFTCELLNDNGSVTIRTWTDGTQRRVEEMLPEMIRGVFEAADAARARWKQQREDQRRQMEEAKQRHEAEQRRKAEQARVEELIREVERWELSRRIRRYLRAVERTAIEQHGHIDEGSEMDHWLNWGHAVADRNDPLGPRPRPGPAPSSGSA